MSRKAKRLTCKRPDRDVPKLRCGYPLPCPHHTVTISLRPAAIELPREPVTLAALVRLDEIADALTSENAVDGGGVRAGGTEP